jgi:hypothetical protein
MIFQDNEILSEFDLLISESQAKPPCDVHTQRRVEFLMSMSQQLKACMCNLLRQTCCNFKHNNKKKQRITYKSLFNRTDKQKKAYPV